MAVDLNQTLALAKQHGATHSGLPSLDFEEINSIHRIKATVQTASCFVGTPVPRAFPKPRAWNVTIKHELHTNIPLLFPILLPYQDSSQ